MRLSIRLKTMLGTAAIEASLLTALIVVALNFMLESADEALNKRASTTARLFASATKDAVLSFDLASLDTFTTELLSNPDIVYVRVLDGSNQLLASAGTNARLYTAFKADTSVTEVTDGIFDAQALITEEGETFGTVQLGIDIGTINQTMNDVRRWIISIALFEMLLVAIFSYVLGIYLTRNLYRLKQSATRINQNIQSNDYSFEVRPILSKDELQELSLAFAELSNTLIEEHNRRTQFEQELLELNNQLEQRVERRTLKLQEQNEKLEQVNHDLAETQQQLVQSEKMASVGQLAAGVAHEINNPLGFVLSNLNTLKGYVDEYQEACQLVIQFLDTTEQPKRRNIANKMLNHFKDAEFDYLDEDSDEILTESIKGLGRITEIVKNLKQFSRADSDDMHECDINECIKTALNMVSNEVKYHCTINTDLAPLPATMGNMGKLIQVFTNLLFNGGQAIASGLDDSNGNSMGGGKTSGKIDVKTYQKIDTIYVEISDTGKGIPDDILDKIFNPFFTTKPVGEGTGLGLSICYDIIQEHGGDIRVASAVGQGTTFTIALPMGLKDGKQAAQAAEKAH